MRLLGVHLSNSLIEFGWPSCGNSKLKQCHQKDVCKLLAHYASLHKPPGRRPHPRWQNGELAESLQPAQEINILEERQGSEAIHFAKSVSADEKPLISEVE